MRIRRRGIRGWLSAATILCTAWAAVSAASAATSLAVTAETTCAAGGLGVSRITLDTEGVPLETATLSLAFDDDQLEVVGVFPAPFTVADYTLDFVVQDVAAGPDVLEIQLSTGTPQTPAPDQAIVWVALRALGGAGVHTLAWDPAGTLVNGAAADALADGTLTSATADVALTIADDISGETGQIVSVPVVADPADDLSSFDLTLEFDPTVLQFLDAKTTDATASFFLAFNELEPGKVAVALFDLSGGSIPPGTGATDIATYNFRIQGSPGVRTPLDLTRAITDDGVETCRDDGLLEICADADGDGVSACSTGPLDCDDTDPDVYPGAPEICDGKDNQCAGDAGFGQIDEGFDPDADQVGSCVDNCPEDANADQADQDGDGRGDVCDCAPSDPADPPPAEVSNSIVAARSGATVELTWDDQGLPGVFPVYRGTIDVGAPFAYDHVCLGTPPSAPSVQDSEVPVSGRIFTYLISRRDACGESGLGPATGGPRPAAAPCP